MPNENERLRESVKRVKPAFDQYRRLKEEHKASAVYKYSTEADKEKKDEELQLKIQNLMWAYKDSIKEYYEAYTATGKTPDNLKAMDAREFLRDYMRYQLMKGARSSGIARKNAANMGISSVIGTQNEMIQNKTEEEAAQQETQKAAEQKSQEAYPDDSMKSSWKGIDHSARNGVREICQWAYRNYDKSGIELAGGGQTHAYFVHKYLMAQPFVYKMIAFYLVERKKASLDEADFMDIYMNYKADLVHFKDIMIASKFFFWKRISGTAIKWEKLESAMQVALSKKAEVEAFAEKTQQAVKVVEDTEFAQAQRRAQNVGAAGGGAGAGGAAGQQGRVSGAGSAAGRQGSVADAALSEQAHMKKLEKNQQIRMMMTQKNKETAEGSLLDPAQVSQANNSVKIALGKLETYRNHMMEKKENATEKDKAALDREKREVIEALRECKADIGNIDDVVKSKAEAAKPDTASYKDIIDNAKFPSEETVLMLKRYKAAEKLVAKIPNVGKMPSDYLGDVLKNIDFALNDVNAVFAVLDVVNSVSKYIKSLETDTAGGQASAALGAATSVLKAVKSIGDIAESAFKWAGNSTVSGAIKAAGNGTGMVLGGAMMVKGGIDLYNTAHQASQANEAYKDLKSKEQDEKKQRLVEKINKMHGYRTEEKATSGIANSISGGMKLASGILATTGVGVVVGLGLTATALAIDFIMWFVNYKKKKNSSIKILDDYIEIDKILAAVKLKMRIQDQNHDSELKNQIRYEVSALAGCASPNNFVSTILKKYAKFLYNETFYEKGESNDNTKLISRDREDFNNLTKQGTTTYAYAMMLKSFGLAVRYPATKTSKPAPDVGTISGKMK